MTTPLVVGDLYALVRRGALVYWRLKIFAGKAYFFMEIFCGSGLCRGRYDPEDEWEAHTGIPGETKEELLFMAIIAFFCLPPKRAFTARQGTKILAYCLHREEGMYYIYDKNPSCLVPITATKISTTGCARNNVSLFGWEQYKSPYYNWVWQRNADGFGI